MKWKRQTGNMAVMHKKILIIADIEGSSWCTNYESTTFLHSDWPKACVGLSLDVDAVVKSLFNAGVEKVYVKDFHRTAYNLLPEFIDKRAIIIPGYRLGPVPGLGDPFDATAVMMIGMHAPSGADGFLPHTLTSRIAKLEVNGRLMSEAQLFAASLAPFNISPIFFSGCPVACRHAAEEIESLRCFPIEKNGDGKTFSSRVWRDELAKEAALSLKQGHRAYMPEGNFEAVVTMRDGKKYAKKIANRWKHKYSHDKIFINSGDIQRLYHDLIRLCYFTPFIEKILPLGLPLFNLRGKVGLAWAKAMIKDKENYKRQH